MSENNVFALPGYGGAYDPALLDAPLSITETIPPPPTFQQQPLPALPTTGQQPPLAPNAGPQPLPTISQVGDNLRADIQGALSLPVLTGEGARSPAVDREAVDLTKFGPRVPPERPMVVGAAPPPSGGGAGGGTGGGTNPPPTPSPVPSTTIPAPPGYAWSINPLTNQREFVDLTPLDQSQPLSGWHWIPDDQTKPNVGHWNFLPDSDMLDNPFKGIPPQVIGWLQHVLNNGPSSMTDVPEGPARTWVQYIINKEMHGRRPDAVPFGLGLPNFPTPPSIPNAPVTGIPAAMLLEVGGMPLPPGMATGGTPTITAGTGAPSAPADTTTANFTLLEQRLRDSGVAEETIQGILRDAINKLMALQGSVLPLPPA